MDNIDNDVEQWFSSPCATMSSGYDLHIYNHLRELVLLCDMRGQVYYANPAAQNHCNEMLEGKPFNTLLVADIAHKGDAFFAAALAASPEAPTPEWELTLGSSLNYLVANFRGYREDESVVLLGEVEAEKVNRMQQELLELTVELSDAQRQVQRQNRDLQRSLDEQRRLLQTIQELSAPIVPILDNVLLLPLVGHIDDQRAHSITEEILQHVQARKARSVILDVTSIAAIDTAVARHLLDTAHAIRLLGAQTILVGMRPAIAETIVHLGIDLHGFVMHSDLQHAIVHVLQQRNRSYR
jgi:anti-anti-sigma factor